MVPDPGPDTAGSSTCLASALIEPFWYIGWGWSTEEGVQISIISFFEGSILALWTHSPVRQFGFLALKRSCFWCKVWQLFYTAQESTLAKKT